jgi:hypothetical protein
VYDREAPTERGGYMRKVLIKIAAVAALAIALAIAWIFGVRPLSLLLDRFETVESASIPIKMIVYEGSGTGGMLHFDDLGLSLSPADPREPPPNIGTTKDNQLALSHGGKVFPFGPLRSGETLAAETPPGDNASISIRHSALSWPTQLDFNFMTGQSPSWKRYLYYRVAWKKQSGAKLEMLWRYEQYFYPGNGWAAGMMTREGVTGLVRVQISP